MKINYEFIENYEFWLKTVRHCDHNATMKYLANFKKIVRRCVRNGWISKDPFDGFKLAVREVKRTALTEEELERIRSKNFQSERVQKVRDIFLFSCYTGLAYADLKKLRLAEIAKGIDGTDWIFTRREKTDTESRVPSCLKQLPFWINIRITRFASTRTECYLSLAIKR
ncbi:phage integrase SAM-like domain-containing protein [Puia sp. P3]|uniref:phage integrase SAM-like domain-containing protein n=1 Tax=Puia sp. P3 TaxID=3423952 RepID=UPI003D6714FE